MPGRSEDTGCLEDSNRDGRPDLEQEVYKLLDETGGKALFPDAARRGIKCSMKRFYELRRQWAASDAGDSNEIAAGEPQVRKGLQAEASGSLTVEEGEVLEGPGVAERNTGSRTEEVEHLGQTQIVGTTVIYPEVVAAIARRATEAVEGVAAIGTPSLRSGVRERIRGGERMAGGVEVELGRREVILNINVRVIYGYSIPTIVLKVREALSDRLLQLCGLVAKEINVRVAGMEFPGRMPGRVE